MEWLELFPDTKEPTIDDFKKFISNKLFDTLLSDIETDYKLKPQVEYSKCSGAAGWNIKFKKSAKSLCVIYPHKKYFTTLVVIGKKEEEKAMPIIKASNEYIINMYKNTRFVCGGRWLMIDIRDNENLKIAKDLMYTRLALPKK